VGVAGKLAAKHGFLGDPDGIAEPRIDVSQALMRRCPERA
jgi:hypothetical protein